MWTQLLLVLTTGLQLKKPTFICPAARRNRGGRKGALAQLAHVCMREIPPTLLQGNHT